MKYPEEILRERIKVLEEALEFYADKRNWDLRWTEHDQPQDSIIEEDDGRLAREALKKERQ